MRAGRAVAIAFAAFVAAGCVERTLVVESDPPGAEVRLNGSRVGGLLSIGGATCGTPGTGMMIGCGGDPLERTKALPDEGPVTSAGP